MNKSFKSAILCLFLMLGVIGFLGAAENVKAPHPYQMMNVSGKTAGNSEYSISYPIFEETSLSKLNQLIAKTVADFYLSVMEPDYEDDMSMSYDYSCEYSITFSGKYISILMSVYAYTGGAHGNYGVTSICYDTKKNEAVSITEVVGKTKQELTKYIYDKLNKMPETFKPVDPDLSLNTFTVENGTATVYYSPYEVAPWAAGVIEVEIK